MPVMTFAATVQRQEKEKKGRHEGGLNSFSISGDAANHSDGLCLFPNHSDDPDRLGALSLESCHYPHCRSRLDTWRQALPKHTAWELR